MIALCCAGQVKLEKGIKKEPVEAAPAGDAAADHPDSAVEGSTRAPRQPLATDHGLSEAPKTPAPADSFSDAAEQAGVRCILAFSGFAAASDCNFQHKPCTAGLVTRREFRESRLVQ